SQQLKHVNEFYASIKERLSKSDIDLAKRRDVVENLHLAAIESEAVNYAGGHLHRPCAIGGPGDRGDRPVSSTGESGSVAPRQCHGSVVRVKPTRRGWLTAPQPERGGVRS